jgi:hypothetical protein
MDGFSQPTAFQISPATNIKKEESSASDVQLVVDVATGKSQELFPCAQGAEFGSQTCPCIAMTGTSEQRVVTFSPSASMFGPAVMSIGITDGVAPPASFKTANGEYDWLVVDVENIPDLPFFADGPDQTAYVGSTKTIYARV